MSVIRMNFPSISAICMPKISHICHPQNLYTSIPPPRPRPALCTLAGQYVSRFRMKYFKRDCILLIGAGGLGYLEIVGNGMGTTCVKGEWRACKISRTLPSPWEQGRREPKFLLTGGGRKIIHKNQFKPNYF